MVGQQLDKEQKEVLEKIRKQKEDRFPESLPSAVLILLMLVMGCSSLLAMMRGCRWLMCHDNFCTLLFIPTPLLLPL